MNSGEDQGLRSGNSAIITDEQVGRPQKRSSRPGWNFTFLIPGHPAEIFIFSTIHPQHPASILNRHPILQAAARQRMLVQRFPGK
jgi:hypothetical protein